VTTVLVVARRATARARLEAVVTGSRALGLVSAPPGVALGRQIDAARPDVVLLDVGGEGVAAALAAAREARDAAMVVLAAVTRRAVAAAMAGGPIRAVLPRDATSGEILAAIEAVAAGLVALHPDGLGASPPPELSSLHAAREEPLTARELEVLAMLVEGLGNREIAAALGISRHTAKFHVASILGKLGARTRAEAVAIGLRRGLVAV
jgi:NarL family two-component system response regulator YdfI